MYTCVTNQTSFKTPERQGKKNVLRQAYNHSTINFKFALVF